MAETGSVAAGKLGRVLLLIGLLCVFGACVAKKAHADGETVYACGSYPNNIFYESDAVGFEEVQNGCVSNGNGGYMEIYSSGGAADGADAVWETQAPPGLQIEDAAVQSYTATGLNMSGDPFAGGLFWGGSSTALYTGSGSVGPLGIGPSSYFGFQLFCEAGGNACSDDAALDIYGVTLTVAETSGPSISAGGLWSQSGWVRGTWPITVSGDSPTGVCAATAAISGDPVSASESSTPNQSVWHQCDSGLSQSMDTALAINGQDTLTVSDTDAAGESSQTDELIGVDNQTPTISLSSPGTALSTSGTQHVEVSVSTGPSGAYGADCSVDGGPETFYAGASSQVAVSGVGDHMVSCSGLNNALNASGQRAQSAVESTTLDIQQPTVEAISFSKLADALRCRVVTERVKRLGKPRTIRLHGREVEVRAYRTIKRRVRRCSARTVRRRVLVELRVDGRVVRRHGRIVRVRRWRRVVLLPHRVYQTVRRIRHGARTTVSGVLLLSDGTPLAGQSVTILATPTDGDPEFAPVSTATTNQDGSWVAEIPPGPSRTLQAVYGGTASVAAASSMTVSLVVPAEVRIMSHTRAVSWGQTVTFIGRVYGGGIPPGGVNLALRYAYGGSWTTYAVKTHVAGSGRFETKFTFGPGPARIHMGVRFRFATLPAGDYPWAQAQSNTVAVEVGGHPRVAHPRRDHRGRRRRR